MQEKVRPLVIAARESVVLAVSHLRGVCAVCWTDHVSNSERQGCTAFQCAHQRKSHPRAVPAALGMKVLVLEASRERYSSRTTSMLASSGASEIDPIS